LPDRRVDADYIQRTTKEHNGTYRHGCGDNFEAAADAWDAEFFEGSTEVKDGGGLSVEVQAYRDVGFGLNKTTVAVARQ
jgi:hypothetical protein